MRRLVVLVFTACTATERTRDAGSPDAGACGCARYGAVADVGLVGEPALTELSGLAASVKHAGVLYAHNDSGDGARFFTLSVRGAPLGQITLRGATARDWEAIAVGPCPAGSCVYIGDFGDNARARADYAIYRVPEPDAIDGPSTLGGWERFGFAYPSHAKHDAEALVVHPKTGRVYVITKDVPEVFAFPAPLDASAEVELTSIATLPLSGEVITDASASPCGDAILLRTYQRVIELRAADFDSIFQRPLLTVPSAVEEQGEAIAFERSGRAYVTSSEKNKTEPRISRVACE